MLGKQLTRANFSRCVSHPRDSLLFTTKMYGHRPWEPVYTSGEAVRVGRGSNGYLDVIIRYNNPGFGRGGNLSLLLYNVCAKLGLLKRYRILNSLV